MYDLLAERTLAKDEMKSCTTNPGEQYVMTCVMIMLLGLSVECLDIMGK